MDPAPPSPPTRRAVLTRALGATASFKGLSALSGNDPLPAGVTPTPVAQRRVGLNYSIWHKTVPWKHAWGTPLRGFYTSDDSAVIRGHAGEIAGMGVDFIILDATNDLGSDIRRGQGTQAQLFEERVIARIFEEYLALRTSLKLVFMVGYPATRALFDGSLNAKVDELHDTYIANPRYSSLLEIYQGKPLLIVYGLTPSPYRDGLPPWNDARFTVRHMTAGLTQQPALLGSAARHTEKISKFGYWSWQDRQAPAYPVVGGHPEAMTLTAFWPKDVPNHRPGRGRMGGTTYLADWARARRIGPRFAIAGTYNEWSNREQPSREMSKDLEPSVEFGTFYADLARSQAALFKAGK